MPLDQSYDHPMYLIGRLAALGDTDFFDQPPGRLSDRELAVALVSPLKALPMLMDRIHVVGRDNMAKSVMALIPSEGLPAGPVSIEDQGDYWLGYHHQRGYPRQVWATRDDIEEAGQALYGERWQTDMSRLFGYTDAARLRAILRGDRALAGGALADLVAELRQRSAETAEIAGRLEVLLQIDGDPQQD